MLKKEIISEDIRNMIITGKLSEGDPVFSREYSTKYGVNPKTANEAIWLLANEGLLCHRPGSVYHVADGACGMATQTGIARIKKEARTMVARAKALGLSKKTFLGVIGKLYKT